MTADQLSRLRSVSPAARKALAVREPFQVIVVNEAGVIDVQGFRVTRGTGVAIMPSEARGSVTWDGKPLTGSSTH